MTTYAELQEQIERLTKQAEKLKSDEKLQAIVDIRNKMNAYGITPEDIANAPKSVSKAKYADDKGNSWSGVGKKPKWFVELIDKGVPIDTLKV